MARKRNASTLAGAAQVPKRRRIAETSTPPRQTRSRAALPGAEPLIALDIGARRRRIPNTKKQAVDESQVQIQVPALSTEDRPEAFVVVQVLPSVGQAAASFVQDKVPTTVPERILSVRADHFEREGAPSPETPRRVPRVYDNPPLPPPELLSMFAEHHALHNSTNDQLPFPESLCWQEYYEKPEFTENYSFKPRNPSHPTNLRTYRSGLCNICFKECRGACLAPEEISTGISPTTVPVLEPSGFPTPRPEADSPPQSHFNSGELTAQKRKLSSVQTIPASPPPSPKGAKTAPSSPKSCATDCSCFPTIDSVSDVAQELQELESELNQPQQEQQQQQDTVFPNYDDEEFIHDITRELGRRRETRRAACDRGVDPAAHNHFVTGLVPLFEMYHAERLLRLQGGNGEEEGTDTDSLTSSTMAVDGSGMGESERESEAVGEGGCKPPMSPVKSESSRSSAGSYDVGLEKEVESGSGGVVPPRPVEPVDAMEVDEEEQEQREETQAQADAPPASPAEPWIPSSPQTDPQQNPSLGETIIPGLFTLYPETKSGAMPASEPVLMIIADEDAAEYTQQDQKPQDEQDPEETTSTDQTAAAPANEDDDEAHPLFLSTRSNETSLFATPRRDSQKSGDSDSVAERARLSSVDAEIYEIWGRELVDVPAQEWDVDDGPAEEEPVRVKAEDLSWPSLPGADEEPRRSSFDDVVLTGKVASQMEWE